MNVENYFQDKTRSSSRQCNVSWNTLYSLQESSVLYFLGSTELIPQ